MFLNCMFSIRFWRDFSILILLSDIAISTFPLCLCVENTLSKSKLVTLLKWDVKFDTLVTGPAAFLVISNQHLALLPLFQIWTPTCIVRHAFHKASRLSLVKMVC